MVGLPCDSTIGTNFGESLTLRPGIVYCITSAATLTGDLILDAAGDPDGIFIIKINGALTTSTSSNVILQSGASTCNVYWQIGGATNLGISSTFKGTILGDGAINLLDGASLDGKGLTRAGQISLNNNSAVVCDAVTLPIELISFKAQPVGSSIQLNWSTASETNNDYFTIHRSNDASSFKEVIRVEGSGNSNSVRHYTAIDDQPLNGNTYYRLQQTDYDGTSKFSDIIVVHFEKSVALTIYPNPFNTTITVAIDDISQKMSKYELKIFNVSGKEIMSTILTERLTTLATGKLYSGMYIYTVLYNKEILQSGRMISNSPQNE